MSIDKADDAPAVPDVRGGDQVPGGGERHGGAVPATHAPTLEDVARAAKVSRQTVSNVLNAPSRVRPETLERVNAVIRELDYRPNRLARSLRMQSTRMLGYRIEPTPVDAVNAVLDRFLHALADAARREGYHLLLFTADEASERATYEELVRGAVVDGFVLSETGHNDPRPGWLAELGTPFVSFGRTDSDEHPWVDVDGAAGTAMAVDHLVERGHRRIAFLGWPAGSATGDRRASGWRDAVTAHGLAAGDDLLARDLNAVENGAAMAGRLLDSSDPPTAFVCVSDALALGALGLLLDRGLTPGRDAAVVGFDDTPAAALVRPALTSVRQPLEEVGRTVVHLLTGRLRDEPSSNVLLTPSLVVRMSS